MNREKIITNEISDEQRRINKIEARCHALTMDRVYVEEKYGELVISADDDSLKHCDAEFYNCAPVDVQFLLDMVNKRDAEIKRLKDVLFLRNEPPRVQICANTTMNICVAPEPDYTIPMPKIRNSN